MAARVLVLPADATPSFVVPRASFMVSQFYGNRGPCCRVCRRSVYKPSVTLMMLEDSASESIGCTLTGQRRTVAKCCRCRELNTAAALPPAEYTP